ncbi:MAG: hypothetical protein LBI13_03585 [Streptococcaceae bacterium]|nr:hypothetical protein [Streptococcaceae bacterium]
MRSLIKISSLCALGIISLSFATQIDASVSSSDIEKAKNNIAKQFDKLKDTDKVLPLGDGGYLYGKARNVQVGVKNIPSNTPYDYDSEANNKSITVSEAKKQSLDNFIKDSNNKESEIAPMNFKYSFKILGSSPPSTSAYKALSQGSIYYSKAFTGTGWEYAGIWFYNIAETNGYSYFEGPLSFKSNVDSGRVGDIDDVNNMYYNNLLAGYPLEPSAGFVNITSGVGGNPLLLYFTYHPLPGTSYTVIGTGLRAGG